jgi:hypothetical protein
VHECGSEPRTWSADATADGLSYPPFLAAAAKRVMCSMVDGNLTSAEAMGHDESMGRA